MKLVQLKCPSCGAALNTDQKTAFCQYCGAKLLIDDEAQRVDVTYRKVDEARIRENERKEAVRLKELEMADKEDKRSWIGMFALLLLICLGLVLLSLWDVSDSGPGENEIKVPASASSWVDRDYEVVAQEMEAAGFTDISTMPLADLTIGWAKKMGAVEKVSINGDSGFSKGTIFPKDAKVIITYHSKKK